MKDMRPAAPRLRRLKRAMAAALAAAAAPAAAAAWELEAGRATTNDTFSTPAFNTIEFQAPFAVPPVVVVLPTDQGADSATLRIRNVTETGFDLIVVESPGEDGPHASMTVDYVAMEPGAHVLPSGETVVAGRVTTAAVQRAANVGGPSGLETVAFSPALASTAVVVASIQTLNSETGAIPGAPSQPFLNVSVQNPSSASIDLALERGEAAAGTVLPETIGYIAFPDGGAGVFEDDAGVEIDWAADLSADVIVGFDNGCTNVPFSSFAFPDARVVATMNGRDGNNGGWLRRCALTATEIGLVVDEDVANDAERNHTTERASLLAFSSGFHATFAGELAAAKTVSIIEDPQDAGADLFALPGARARYRLDVQNVGETPVDADSIVLIDNLPPDLSLRVADIDGPGSGPVLFTEGAPPSGLTYTFGGLSDPLDDVDFSNDGAATFAYTPIEGANGADPAVTHIRIRPKGVFASNLSGAAPNFSVAFDTIVD